MGDKSQEQRITPAFRVTDYTKSKAFYVDGLGFKVVFEHRFKPGFPVFAEVVRDGMSFYLTEHAGDCKVGGLIHMLVEDVDALYEEFLNRGIRIHEPPNEDLPNLRMMTIVDRDGNQIRFHAPTGNPPNPGEYTEPDQ